MSELVSSHYDESYFKCQKEMGKFGGWAHLPKYTEFVSGESRVLDFGCGGGFLLKALTCKKRIGVEVNPAAVEMARKNGIEVYSRVADVPDNYVDVIISDNALEHTLQPLEELKQLYSKLVPGGKIIFTVPCESISFRYQPNHIDHHLYSWSPMCIGNLFTEAGFSVIESKPYIHKWPPKYDLIAKLCGRAVFNLACRIYGRLNRLLFQVRIVAERVR